MNDFSPGDRVLFEHWMHPITYAGTVKSLFTDSDGDTYLEVEVKNLGTFYPDQKRCFKE